MATLRPVRMGGGVAAALVKSRNTATGATTGTTSSRRRSRSEYPDHPLAFLRWAPCRPDRPVDEKEEVMEKCMCGKTMVPAAEVNSGTTQIVAKCPEFGSDEVMFGPGSHVSHQYVVAGKRGRASGKFAPGWNAKRRDLRG